MKKALPLLALALALIFALSACGNNAPAPADNPPAETTDAQVTTEPAAAPDAGFDEIPIFEDEEVGFMNVSAVYFQPVPMAPGQENFEDFDMHLECDVSAMENNLGYGVGDWIPYLTVDYAIINSKGETAAEGTFMPMSASDGPHYGANIKLADADTYSVKLTFHSPAENNYLLHTDAETGPGAASFDEYFPDGKLELELKDVWDYTPQEW